MFTSADLLPPPPPPPPSAESPPSSTDYHLDNDGYQGTFFLLESVSDDYGDESSSSSSGSSSSSSSAPNNNKYGGDHFYNEETPLVGHVSYRKTEPPPSNASSKKNDIFRSAGSGSGRGSKQDQKFSLRTIYSAISDTMSATGCTNQTDDSWTEDGDGRDDSDNVKIIINTKSDYSDDDDDDEDRSIYSLANESVRSLTTLTTVQLDNFKEGLKIPFTDETGSVSHIINGLSSLFVIGTTLGIIMPKDDDLSTTIYKFISSVIGYNYFVLWSICFYPQVLLNYRRKSTHGLSNDFAILNFMGWTFYSSYVCSMFYSTTIQDMYEERFGTGAAITVQSNDVAFAIHAATLSFIYIVQIVWYSGRWSESKSKFPLKPQTWILVFSMGIPSVTIPICIHLGILDTTRWLDYFYLLSFFKICCTLTKYTKQVMHNYHRKSTKGWNIWYNFLECTGGTLSMIQVVCDSWNMHDMTGITGDLAKFALGCATIFFDALFFTQHYVLYPSSPPTLESNGQEEKNHLGIPTMIKTSSRLDLSKHTTSEDTDNDDDDDGDSSLLSLK